MHINTINKDKNQLHTDKKHIYMIFMTQHIHDYMLRHVSGKSEPRVGYIRQTLWA